MANNSNVDLLGEEILRIRGDTAPDEIFDYDETTNAPRNITGFQYTLTVNTVRNPVGAVPPALVTITGVVLTPLAGHVQFPWSSGDADQASGDYWYDIQRIDGSGRRKTIAKNRYFIRQDLTKS